MIEDEDEEGEESTEEYPRDSRCHYCGIIAKFVCTSCDADLCAAHSHNTLCKACEAERKAQS